MLVSKLRVGVAFAQYAENISFVPRFLAGLTFSFRRTAAM